MGVPLIHILLAWRLVDNAAKGDLLCPQGVHQLLPVAWQANGKLAQDAVKAGTGESIKAAKALDLLGQGVGLPPVHARQGELGVKGVHCVYVVLPLPSASPFKFTLEFERNRFGRALPCFTLVCHRFAIALPCFAIALPCFAKGPPLLCFAKPKATFIQFPK
jgi:hypothetical protein